LASRAILEPGLALALRVLRSGRMVTRRGALVAMKLSGAGVVALEVLLCAAPAHAFCRSTTCDERVDCEYDRQGCPIVGATLAWKSSCVSYAVQQDASPLRGIDYGTIHEVTERAFARWTGADCDGASPALSTLDLGPATCDEPEYNQSAPNANVVLFRDQDWPYEDADITVAQTLLTFDTETGEIFDADIEVNSFTMRLSTSPSDRDYDLESVITHEAGHFLGLYHSRIQGAVMFGRNAPGIIFRELEADDEAGICAVYPPNRRTPYEDCRPRHGFSPDCAPPADDGGCAVAALPTNAPVSVPLLLGLVVGVVGVGRRRLRQAS